MGFSGDFVLVRSDRPLLEAKLFETGCAEGHVECLTACRPRPGGWQTVQVHHGLRGDDMGNGADYAHWLRTLVEATDSPVLIATVMDSDLCEVRGLAPSGLRWTTLLDPVMAADYGVPVPTGGHTAVAERVAAWAGEAGFHADSEALHAVLTKRADPFVEDLIFELIDAAGLPAGAPDEPDSGAPDSPLHPGHRPTLACPRGAALETTVLNLHRDDSLVLECAECDDCYIQVWHRPDGTFQLEYRDRSPDEHYQTRTVSTEKVITAFSGWLVGEVSWRDQFQWTPFSSQ